MDKTVVVRIDRRMPHPTYGKMVTRTARLKAHDEENSAKVSAKLQPWRVKSLFESERLDEEDARKQQTPTDLSEYLNFDRDFFEDLADKQTVPTSSERTNSSLFSAQIRPAKKNKPPVPVYSQLQIEEADEDDVELDHVRVKLPPKEIRQPVRKTFHKANKQRRSRTNEPDKATRKRVAQTTRKSSRDTSQKSKVEDDDNEEDDDEDEAKTSPRKSPKRQHKMRRKPNQRQRKQNQKSQSSGNREPEDSKNNSSAEQEERDGDEGGRGENEANAEQNAKGDSNEAAADEDESDKPVEDEADERDPMRRHRKRLKGAGWNKQLDRDEIPAPIATGGKASGSSRKQTSRAAPTPATNHRNNKRRIDANQLVSNKHLRGNNKLKLTGHEEADTNRRTRTNRPVRIKRQKKKHLNTPAKKDVANLKQGLGKKRSEKAVQSQKKKNSDVEVDDEKDLRPKALENQKDLDYYTEGTSYMGGCDDSGKCSATLHSSDPKLGNAIRARDDKSIVTHLNKWIREEPD